MAHTTKDARGTGSYLAPELLEEHAVVTKAVDIWGLGCLLYEVATSKPAFSGYHDIRDYAVAKCILKIPVFPFEKYRGVSLADTIHTLLKPDPSKRPSIEDVFTLPIHEHWGIHRYGHIDSEKKSFRRYDWVTAEENALIATNQVRTGLYKACFH